MKALILKRENPSKIEILSRFIELINNLNLGK